MKLPTIELFRYALPLREALTTQSPTSTQENALREGLLIVLHDTSGTVGIGEIAPLPGLHHESLVEAEAQTRSIIDQVQGEEIFFDENENDENEVFVQKISAQKLFPSVQCGVEMAFLSFHARRHNIFPGQSFPSERVTPSHLPLNALIAGKSDTIAARAQEVVQGGYTTLKIKVGRMTPDDDIAVIRACRQAVGGDIALRLDANRSWSLATATRLGKALQDCGIAYIEEPLKDWRDIPAFHEATGIRVALDEMLYSANASERAARSDIPSDSLAAYVLKPAALGSIAEASRLASEANARGLDAVVSSVFETGVALGFYAALATTWNGGRSVACGLDTYKFLAADILEHPFSAENGVVSLPEAWERSAHLHVQRHLLRL